ncbi:hypothetical protein [Natranaeroarchaeum aerophilus]|uniref:Uncharacterized protein n=1 Tax=Natranaeroarchaeum aerophilus TaxID=2917711 RepID=A0AAE3FRX0_9EURY|nr:hypothetical protein [Natranaeroarchaeum aerophilus]MCL9813965.1 hypothetical protein [Natranaeroarchaeum aerophilus]
MTTLSTEAEELHRSLIQDYVSSIRENGINDASKYLEELNAFQEGRITDKKEVREFLQDADFPLEIFYRVAPTIDQDVMIATLNPGMQSTIELSTFTDGEYRRQYEAGADLCHKASIVASNLDGFLTHNKNSFAELIEILREELDLMDGSGQLEDYLNYGGDSSPDGFFDEVCYTWMYKLATQDIGYIDDLGGPDYGFARERFAEEVFDVVDPKVLVSVGKHGWVTVWEYLERNYSERPEDLIEAYSDEVPVTKSFNSTFREGAYAGLFYVEVEDLWVITTWHASHWIKSDRLRENARVLNSELNPS